MGAADLASLVMSCASLEIQSSADQVFCDSSSSVRRNGTMSSVGHTPSFRWKPGGPSLRSEVLVQPRMSFRKVPDFGSSECAAAAHECASESLAAALISTLQLKVQVVQTYHFRTVPPFARNNFLA